MTGGNGTGGTDLNGNAGSAHGPTRPRIVVYGLGSCGGCDIAILNIHEKILELDAAFEIVMWPVVMDGKYRDLEALHDGSVDLALVSGSVRTEADEEHARLLRRTAKTLVAFGSCSNEGCIPGLANLGPVTDLLNTVYETVSTENPDHVRPRTACEMPEGVLSLTPLEPLVRTLDQVVPVDYHVPGCPPEPPQIARVLDLVLAALAGTAELPPRGATIGAGISTVCDECPRTRNVKKITHFARIQHVERLDPVLCLLEQGIPCNGPATRDGCAALCPTAGAQCIGCYGPSEGVIDFGARLLTAYASVIDAKTPEGIEPILDGIPDPAGQFYRFSLARSLLRAGRSAWPSDGRAGGAMAASGSAARPAGSTTTSAAASGK